LRRGDDAGHEPPESSIASRRSHRRHVDTALSAGGGPPRHRRPVELVAEDALLEGALLEGVLLEGVLLEGALLEGALVEQRRCACCRSGPC